VVVGGIPVGETDFVPSAPIQTDFGSKPVSYSMGTVNLCRRYSRGSVMLTTPLHLVLKLGMNGAIISLPVSPFTAWGGTLIFYFYSFCCCCCTLNCCIFYSFPVP